MSKPCPFCGDLRDPDTDEVVMTFGEPNLFVSVCKCCGARGPLANTRGAALIYWDERRAPGDTKGFIALSDKLSGFNRTPPHE